MRFLLLPASNTLSHLAKCLALRDVLLGRGHEVHLAVAQGRSGFLRRLGVPHELVPDLQEADGAAAPTFAWFRPARFEACVRAELALIRRLRPDRVLGVFRFTGALAARLAGVPYDALVCGCMTPACEETLGFAPGDDGEARQAEAIAFFRRAAAARLAPAFARLGVPAAADAWELLLGDRTFLWDTPEFQPLRPRAGLVHVGPVTWSGWPTDGSALERLAVLRPPLAVVALGTGGGHDRVAARLVELLLRLGFSVAVAGGGSASLPARAGAQVTHFEFLPVEAALERAAVVACHGGQGIVLEALRQRVPVLVVPFQPEQAQNGRCLERLGCGLRLEHGAPAHPDAPPVEDVFLARPLDQLGRRAAGFLGDAAGHARRAAAARMLARCGGVGALAAGLERPLAGASARRLDRRSTP